MLPPSAAASSAARSRGENEVPGPGRRRRAGGGVRSSTATCPGCSACCGTSTARSPPTSTAAHIHVGTADVGRADPDPAADPGRSPPASGTSRRQCVSDVDDALLDARVRQPRRPLRQRPHRRPPDGAVRGQLTALATPLGTRPHRHRGGARARRGRRRRRVDRSTSTTTARPSARVTVYDGAGTPMAAHIHKAAPAPPAPSS